ncbi:MAG: ribonuclease Z [Prevotella sp.]|nr:ribonuclease Z [Prevotella sp.]
MEPFKIYILGCGSALPTSKHQPTSQIVEIRGKMFMLDCGEGVQLSLRRSHIHFNRITSVFISHLHGDHCFGLIGMLSTFGLLGRTAPIHIYAPGEFEPLLHAQLDMFCSGMSYKVEFHAVDTSKHKIIYEDRSLTIESIPLEHRINCCGFLFREKPTLPHINREMVDFYGVSQSQFGNIKMGMDWVSPDGEVIPYTKLTTPADKPRSYAFCSDTKYMPQLHQLLQDVNVIYHESTYDKANEDRAISYYHSTGEQAAMVARDSHAGHLLLGHYSARYNDESSILEEARQIFKNTTLTEEGMCFDVK